MTTLRLVEAEAGRPFPFTIGPPFAWAVLGDVLHVAASVGAAGDTACHVAIDARGRTGPVTPLAFVPIALAACGDYLIATGPRRADSRPIFSVLDASGKRLQENELPIVGVPSRWPVPVCLGGGVTRIYWEADASPGSPSRLEWIDWAGDRATPKRVFEWPDRTADLAATALGGDLLLLRMHGQPSAAELVRLSDGEAVQHSPVVGPALAQVLVVGSRVAVPIATLRELRVAWFDDALRAQGPPDLMAAVGTSRLIRSALLVPAGADALLAGYAATGAGADIAQEPGVRAETAARIEQEGMVLYDLCERGIGGIGPSEGLLAAAWLGDRLVIVSGRRRARISVYRIERD